MKTIRGKMTLAMILVGLLPVLLLLGFSATRTVDGLKLERYKHHTSVTREVSRHITSALVNAQGDLGTLSTNPRLIYDRFSIAERKSELERLERDTFTDLSLIDAQGFTILSTTPQEEVQDYSPWFKHAHQNRQATVSSPFMTTAKEALQISVYIPVAEVTEQTVSVIKATVSFDRIVDVLDPVDVGTGGELVLLDQNGNVLFSSRNREVLSRFDDSKAASFWQNTGNYQNAYLDPSGESYSFVREGVWLPDKIGAQQQWALIWFEHGAINNAEISQIYLMHALAALFALALATWIGMSVSRRLTRPIDRLRRFSEQISLGNLEAGLEVGANDEFGMLADTMVTMADEIKQSRLSLETSLLGQAKNRENEIIVREIHHRVKNNLQIIASLFRMNMRRVQGDEAKQVIMESESRLSSMSLLHEAMHRRDDVSQIGLGSYLRSVADRLILRWRTQEKEFVELEMASAEQLVGIDTALPCGLIVNELVTHCLEVGVATTGERSRKVSLDIRLESNGRLALVIRHDNTAGDLAKMESFENSLSFSLVNMMAEQLEAEVQAEWTEDGFVGRLFFAENVYTERVGELVPAGV